MVHKTAIMLQVTPSVREEPPVLIAIIPTVGRSPKTTDDRPGPAIGYMVDLESTPQLRALIKSLGALPDVTNDHRFTKVLVHLAHPDPKDRPEIDLSDREQAVARLLVDGFSYKMIAGELAISLETVRTHMKRIYTKLNVHNSAEAVAKVIRGGFA